jgi:hypothetical protein
MKTKNLFTLGMVLFLLIAIIVIANQLQNKKPSEQSLVFLPQFSISACSQLFVIEGKDTAKIAKKGAGWMVVPTRAASAAAAASPLAQQPQAAPQSVPDDEYPADSTAVQTALEKLKGLKKDDLISQNPQKQSELEVDTAKGIFVEAFDDKAKSLGALYIGKSGPNWDAHFIREKGSNSVYLASGSVRMSFFGSAQKWRNKSIVKFDKAFVKSFAVANADSTPFEIVHIMPASPKDTLVKEGWEISKPEKVKAKKDKADELINTLSAFATSEFETDKALTPDSMGFSKPKLVVSVTLQNGETKTVVIGKKKGSMYWAKNPENTKAVFLIQEYQFNNLNQGVNSFKDVPPPPAPAKKEEAKPAKAAAAKAGSAKKAEAKKAEPKKK